MKIFHSAILLFIVPAVICRSSSPENHETENSQYTLESTNDMKPKTRESHLRFYLKPPREMTMMSSENEVIECQAGGSPPPLMHWLKDGKAIGTNELEEQFSEDYDEENLGESTLGISSTNIRLYLNCITPEESGVYTCVAETPYNRISTHVHVTVDSSSSHESSKVCHKQSMNHLPKVIMWSRKRLEYMGGNVHLYCRAVGSPKPIVEWLDTNGDIITDNQKYKVLPNGDLIIRQLKWTDMGNYACTARNIAGSDRVETFLYPTRPRK